MSDKYTIKPAYTVLNGKTRCFTTRLLKDKKVIAEFVNEHHNTNAQKVCDLLNETARAQGKY